MGDILRMILHLFVVLIRGGRKKALIHQRLAEESRACFNLAERGGFNQQASKNPCNQ